MQVVQGIGAGGAGRAPSVQGRSLPYPVTPYRCVRGHGFRGHSHLHPHQHLHSHLHLHLHLHVLHCLLYIYMYICMHSSLRKATTSSTLSSTTTLGLLFFPIKLIEDVRLLRTGSKPQSRSNAEKNNKNATFLF